MPPSSEIVTLNGNVERITFHNSQNGFSILRISTEKNKEITTLLGSISSIHVGETIKATGKWVNDPHHGLQFKASSINIIPPTTSEALEKYLGSGSIRGIGPVYAKKLVKAFGQGVMDIIEENPERLDEIQGMGHARKILIIQGVKEQKLMKDILIFLHSHKITAARAARIFKVYGERAVEIISHNPYMLARDIKYIGFIKADEIAASLGIDHASPFRIKAAFTHVLHQATEEGHSGLPKEMFILRLMQLLQIPVEDIEKTVKNPEYNQDIIEDTIYDNQEKVSCVFLRDFHYNERKLAQSLLSRKRNTAPWPIEKVDFDSFCNQYNEKHYITLGDSQRKALKQALSSKIMVITGGPGTGKTMIIKALISLFKQRKMHVILTAPTGRATKRLSESTDHEAKTIHRLLEWDMMHKNFKHNAHLPLSCDLLIIDEISMVDIPLMNAVLSALPEKSGLYLIGDCDQLPSIGPGQILKDIIDSQAIPTISLTELYRQAHTSAIVANACRINQGLFPKILDKKEETDFYFIETDNVEKGKSIIIELVTKRIPKKFSFDPVHDIQVLCPMNKGVMGTYALNKELQKLLHINASTNVERENWSFVSGDKVMQIQNDYTKEVFNGDIGFVQDMDIYTQKLAILFDTRVVHYTLDELEAIIPAYAITIHKSQGSEYPVVVIPVTMQHRAMLNRNLIYTAITRGKNLVILVGEKEALEAAIHTSPRKRWSKLREYLMVD